jgi:tyrosyl-tRNA synthetase
MPILRGTDGKLKMSKSYNNHIPVDTAPDNMFGKVMSIPDTLMEEYFSLLTSAEECSFKQLIKENPRQAKGLLARKIVEKFFDEETAEKSEREFEKIFKEKQVPDEIPEFLVDAAKEMAVVDIIFNSGLLTSKAEIRRMITQKAVKIENQTIEDPYAKIKIEDGQVLKVGKRKFLRIKVKEWK